tara:strand:+ start:15662 stop:16408 length:747 start_codon:yes stop_codon:yes gene_type:complete
MKSVMNYKQQTKKLNLLKDRNINEINSLYKEHGEEYLIYLIRLTIKEKDKKSLKFILSNFKFELEESNFVNCNNVEIFEILINYNPNNKHINDNLLWKIVKIKRSCLFLKVLLKNENIKNKTLTDLFYYCCENSHIKYIEAIVESSKFVDLNIDINKAFYSQRNKQITKYFLRFKEINKNVEIINYVIDNFNRNHKFILTDYCNSFIDDFYKLTPYKKYFNNLKSHHEVEEIKNTVIKIKNQIKVEEF